MRQLSPHIIARRAFTLFELLVTISVMGVVVVMVAPEVGDDTQLRLVNAATVLISDIEFAQSNTISDPSNPFVLQLDPNSSTYWVALASTPERPIRREDTGELYFVRMGAGRAIGATDVTFKTGAMTNSRLEFDAQGGLVDFTQSPTIMLAVGDEVLELRIVPTTGQIVQQLGDTNTAEIPLKGDVTVK